MAVVVVVMGVCGSGKSSVGAELVTQMGVQGWHYADADHFHPPANIGKMSTGQPLTDEDREPWLKALGAMIDEWLANGQCAVLACSALKRAYRSILLGPEEKNKDKVFFVHLNGQKDLIAARLASRAGHFMKGTMLDSQLAALEPLQEGEQGMVIDDLTPTPDKLAASIIARFHVSPSHK